jgi:hypothetical protein
MGQAACMGYHSHMLFICIRMCSAAAHFSCDAAVVVCVYDATDAAAGMQQCVQRWTNAKNVITVDMASGSVSYQQGEFCMVISVSSSQPIQFVRVSGLPSSFITVQQSQQVRTTKSMILHYKNQI